MTRNAGLVGVVVRRRFASMVAFVAITAGAGWLYVQLPGSFLPVEGQGRIFASIQLPPDATLERTDAVVRRYERYVASRPAFHANVAVQGFSFSGSGPNAAQGQRVFQLSPAPRTEEVAEVAAPDPRRRRSARRVQPATWVTLQTGHMGNRWGGGARSQGAGRR